MGRLTRAGRALVPARSTSPPFPVPRLDPTAVVAFARRWSASIGRGDGLTPYHDDVVCGGLAVLSAAGHPVAAALADEVDSAPLERQTTALSAALLRLAARGYCIEPLARFLAALAVTDQSAGADAARAETHAALLAVGHSSGRGLAEGVLTVLRPDAFGAAASRTQTVEVRRGAYQDSVALMQISQDLQRVEGVRSALVAMATELNLDLLDGMGFARPESSPNDMVVAIEADDDEAVGRALTALEDALTRRPVASSDGFAQPAAPTVATAARGAEADLALISTPGRVAVLDAVDALDSGLDVMLFSDK